MVYIVPLAIPLSFAGLESLSRSTFHLKLLVWFFSAVACVVLAWLSQQVLFNDLLWNLPSNFKQFSISASDTYIYSSSPSWALGVAIGAGLMPLVAAYWPFRGLGRGIGLCWQQGLRKNVFSAFALVVFIIMGAHFYHSPWNRHAHDPGILARRIAKTILDSESPISPRTLVVVDPAYVPQDPDSTHDQVAYPLSLDHTSWLLHFWLGGRVNVLQGSINATLLSKGELKLEPLQLDGQRQYGILNRGLPPFRVDPESVIVVFGSDPEIMPYRKPLSLPAKERTR